MLSDLVFRLRSLFRRNTVEAELDDELRFHFEQRSQGINFGMTREEARRQARLSVGGIDRVKEECREERGVQHMENLLQDLPIRLAHAGQEARIHDRGGADARSGSGGEYGHFQHRQRGAAALSPVPSLTGWSRSSSITQEWAWCGVSSWLPELDDLRHRSGVCEYVTGTDAAA